MKIGKIVPTNQFQQIAITKTDPIFEQKLKTLKELGRATHQVAKYQQICSKLPPLTTLIFSVEN